MAATTARARAQTITASTRHTAERTARKVLDRTAKPVVRWAVSQGLPRHALNAAAKRGDLQARLTSDTLRKLPEELAPLFREIRSNGRVVQGKFAKVTVDHELVRQVLTSNDYRTGFDAQVLPVVARLAEWSRRDGVHPVEPPSLLATEPPDHTRYRKLVTKVFTLRAIEKLRSRVEEIAAELLDDLPAGEPVDLIERYCALLPVTVIAEILGVPLSQRARVLQLGEGAAASLDLGLDWSTFRTVEGALDDFDDWLEEHLAAIRANPGDNLLSELVAASEDGHTLTHRELKSVAGLVLAAGFETTVNLLGNAIRLLHDHPDQLALVRNDPTLWEGVVEETLRYDSPVMLTARVATAPNELAGRPVAAGDVVVTVLAAANRDPAVFADPDRYDITRENARDHVAFSAGRHYCLGANLARMESQVALRAFFDRYDVSLLPGATRRPTRVLRGFEYLPATLTPRD